MENQPRLSRGQKDGPKQLWKINVGIGHHGRSPATASLTTSAFALNLAEASPAGYKEGGSAQVIEGRAFTAPAFADGRVYVRNTKGDVVCLDFSGR